MKFVCFCLRFEGQHSAVMELCIMLFSPTIIGTIKEESARCAVNANCIVGNSGGTWRDNCLHWNTILREYYRRLQSTFLNVTHKTVRTIHIQLSC
jgi:hypothetical protein